MKILVVGSGGREHALCRAFSRSKKVEKIFCADGNAGIADVAECVDIKPNEITKLAEFAENSSIDLTFVGGETSLALGIVDEFEKRGLKIIGANRRAARLESSKSFAKNFMANYEIPTAKFKTATSAENALEILQSNFFGDDNSPVVVKADGLAAGKGVVVARNRSEAIEAVNGLENLVGKEAAEKIVLEECLIGKEVSLLMFADGKNFALMPFARDHKRIGENDTGANTGGMGVFTDSTLLNAEQRKEIIENIIEPTLKGARNEGFPFRGILFLGLMLTEDGAKVLEYNVRFGDPETQAILMRLETDLIEICDAMLSQNLDQLSIQWKKGSSVCIVMASRGYPLSPHVGDPIYGLNKAEKIADVFVFHAGTARNSANNLVTAGGRVLGITASAADLGTAIDLAYQTVNQITFEGRQFRRDIGK